MFAVVLLAEICKAKNIQGIHNYKDHQEFFTSIALANKELYKRQKETPHAEFGIVKLLIKSKTAISIVTEDIKYA